ncbi:endoplasmic reticulum-Golgi intermediate compartment protein 3 [Oratosquilla oratoria]|uniref:endoplasmic reticulum-Golgi intermediate compartment protein 3 n=1 Tax=Oratosquilla oratoria TaxID=337810 RepID=UPI003F761674
MDLSGEQHINIQHNIYKRKLDIDGRPIEDPVKQETIGHNDSKSTTAMSVGDAAKETEEKTATEDECGSCYGAEHGGLKCCNTCEEVKEAYRRKGWALPPLKDITQCVKEGKTRESQDLPKEGCQIYGYMEVNRVGGNFHFAPGKSFQHSHLHIHDVQQYRTSDFDLSHRIRHLSFGINIPGKTNPLDSFILQTDKGPKTVTYYLKIVPTTYEKSDGSTLMTNQFSVTKHEKSLSLSHGETGLPGVFFNYELSPLMVKYQEKKKSLGHFLTGVCAIIGGVFTVAGLIDALIYHSSKALQKKIEIGKAT